MLTLPHISRLTCLVMLLVITASVVNTPALYAAPLDNDSSDIIDSDDNVDPQADVDPSVEQSEADDVASAAANAVVLVGSNALKNRGLGRCVATIGSSAKNETHLKAYTCNHSGAQIVTWLTRDSSIHIMGKCFDVPGGKYASGQKVVVYTCNGSAAQKWHLMTDSTIRAAAQTSLCLGLSSTASNAFVEMRSCSGSAWQKWAITPQKSATGRNKLVTGAYIPSAATTGVPKGTKLTKYTGPKTIIKDGTVIYKKEVYGDLIIRARNVTISRSRLHGSKTIPKYNSGIVDATSSKVYKLVVRDSDLKPDRPSYFRDGIVGHDYTSLRNDISHTNDGLGVFSKSGQPKQADVRIYGNYIHDLTKWTKDPAHNDGTHNDGIQIQGGRDIDIVGNRIKDSIVRGDDRKYGGVLAGITPAMHQSNGSHGGSAIIVQDNTGAGLDGTVKVRRNFLSNGSAGAYLKTGSYEFSGNVMYQGSFYMYNAKKSDQYPLRPQSAKAQSEIKGLYTNMYKTSGKVLTFSNRGIRY